MALLTVFASIASQNEQKIAAWQERLQVLKIMHALADSGKARKNINTFVESYVDAVRRERQKRAGELLEGQTRLAREEETRSQLGRYESQVAQLRELLVGKEEQLQFLSQNGKRAKPTTAHCQNLLLFNHESELIDKLKEEFAIKGQLQREILQLQTRYIRTTPYKVKESFQRENIEISYLREFAEQELKNKKLKNIYLTYQAQLSKICNINQILAQKYRASNSSSFFEVSTLESNSKTICQTSDQQSL